MPRRAAWPPRTYPRNGQEIIRIRINGTVTDRTLGPVGSPEARAAYLRIVAELEASGGCVPLKPGTGITIAELLSRWLAEATTEYSLTSREPVEIQRAFRPVLALYGNDAAAEFDSLHLEVVQSAMASGSWMTAEEQAAQRRAGKPLGCCARVVNRRVVRVRTVFRWAERKRLVAKGTWDHLLSVRGIDSGSRKARHSPPPVPSTWVDVERVMAHCPPPVAAMLALQFWSGMRSGEVRTVRRCDLDMSDSEAWVYRPETHKGSWRGADKAVALGPRCIELLNPWLAAHPGPHPLSAPPDPAAYLFPSPRKAGACWRADSYAAAVRRACGRAGVKVLPYGGRHATRMRVTRAAGLDAARAVLGQATVDMAARYGNAVDLEAAKEAAKRCG